MGGERVHEDLSGELGLVGLLHCIHRAAAVVDEALHKVGELLCLFLGGNTHPARETCGYARSLVTVVHQLGAGGSKGLLYLCLGRLRCVGSLQFSEALRERVGEVIVKVARRRGVLFDRVRFGSKLSSHRLNFNEGCFRCLKNNLDVLGLLDHLLYGSNRVAQRDGLKQSLLVLKELELVVAQSNLELLLEGEEPDLPLEGLLDLFLVLNLCGCEGGHGGDGSLVAGRCIHGTLMLSVTEGHKLAT
mmetsp:Transcript_3128/g.6309  ORF Transcript_3128/g.6309 Transcript_3128/m.6309 type:complete len:246 (-) Transcript_3128:1378-2115(-)